MPPQFQVVKYQLQISTAPVAGQGVPAPEFIPGVILQIQTNQGLQQVRLPINSPAEFMAVCALLQVPGSLLFDQQLFTLEKVGP